jgi:hypothetical protein
MEAICATLPGPVVVSRDVRSALGPQASALPIRARRPKSSVAGRLTGCLSFAFTERASNNNKGKTAGIVVGSLIGVAALAAGKTRVSDHTLPGPLNRRS